MYFRVLSAEQVFFGIDSFSNVDTSHICSETHLQSNVEQQVFQQTNDVHVGNSLQQYKIKINIHAIKTNYLTDKISWHTLF